MAKIKVEGDIGTLGVRRVLLMLNELELDYELVPQFPVPITYSDFDKVPFLKDGDVEFKDESSRNIELHLSKGRRHLLNFLNEGTTIRALEEELKLYDFESVGTKLAWEQIFKSNYSGGTIDPTVVKEGEAKLEEFLNRCEKRLAKYQYLTSDRFTVLDLNAIPLIHYLLGTPTGKYFKDKNRPLVSAWIDKIMSRDSSKKVLRLK